ncbi:hypothetical protein C8R47DRAFT_304789 [Mycena vitilis]|nr:hypothetical protein C8R47DRAFT_304789 [Mycena vitilis]
MVHAGHPLRRDATGDAETACISSSNANDSCYPVALTKFVQGQDASFVWNPTLAKFRKTNLVNITIYDGSDEWDGAIGSQNTILQFRNLANPPSGAGLLKVPVNDSWWGEKGAIWAGNVSYPFFWTIWGADEQDTFTVGRQPFFAAIQTTLPDSVRATMLSTMTPLPTQSDVDAGSVTGSITSVPSNSTAADTVSSNSASHRAAIIAAVVGGLAALALILASLLIILRRRRLAENSAVNTTADPHLGVALSAHDEKHSFSTQPPPSKRALDHELRTAHAQLQALRHELGRPGSDSEGDSRMGTDGTDSRVENAELRARIGMLTEEVERLRSMGAEAPPAYSMQDGEEDGDVRQ